MDSEKPYVRIELEKLKELNIDIEKDDYVSNPTFLSLYNEYISYKGGFITEALWVEQNIVGQERLEKIYGPCLVVMHIGMLNQYLIC